jgi:hypothetical protein
MKKVGRPTTNGQRPPWMLERVAAILYAYNRFRKAGEKHSVAVSEAANYIREEAPWMPISETGVKRTIAEWQPNWMTKCMVVTKPDPAHRILQVPIRKDGKVVLEPRRIVYTVSYGSRPVYPRTNAAEKSA